MKRALSISLLFFTTLLFSQSENWEIYNSINSPLSNNKITSASTDYENNIFFGTHEGLVVFNGLTWKNINKTVLLLITILFGLGLFFSLVSTSLIASDKLNTNSYYFFAKHLLFIGIGAFFIIYFSSLNHNDLIKVSKLLFIFFFIKIFFSFFHVF